MTQRTGLSGEGAAELFSLINTARLAMCSGSLAQDMSGALEDETVGREDDALEPEFATDAFSGAKVQTPYQYSIGDSWSGTTLDPAVDGLDPSGLEQIQDAWAHKSTAGTVFYRLPPQQRMASSFAYVEESDTRFVDSVGHDTEQAKAQRCVSELLSQPAQRERLLDPRFRLLGATLTGAGYRFSPSIPDASDDEDALCFGVAAAASADYSATGLATAPTDWVGVWPPAGSTIPFGDIHARGAVDGTRHGYAASLTVDSHYALTTQAFTITDSTGAIVPVTVNLDAISDPAFGNWAFATPITPLPLGVRFTAHFIGTANGQTIDKTWSFNTLQAPVLFDPRNDTFTP